ncbi:MAG: hypothetical protein K2O59_08945 [Lachnospiraceae bacterium]|nr:hypothetical protein [Lachnospiraceae bacterium]
MLFEEMMERGRAEVRDYYQYKIEQLSSTNEQLSSFNEQLSSKIDHLENLLRQHNIQFD